MLIICHVCAEFHNKRGETVLTVSPEMLTGFISAPEEIQEDPLYGMLMADGSLEAGFTEKRRKRGRMIPRPESPPKGRRPRQPGRKPVSLSVSRRKTADDSRGFSGFLSAV